MKARRLIGVDNPVVRDHRVLGRHLLPGFAYIDLLYQLFRKEGRDYRSLELRNLTIYRPLVASAGRGVVLDVRCSEREPEHWDIVIEDADSADRYATAEMCHTAAVAFAETLDLAAIRRTALESIDLDEVYAGYRKLGLVHDAFMRAVGRVYRADSALYVDCRLGEEAHASRARLMFHPALLDAAAGCAGGALGGVHSSEQEELCLPLLVESFRACELLTERCFARLSLDDARRKGDLRFCSIELFDELGRKRAELRNVTSKSMRDVSAPVAAGAPEVGGGPPTVMAPVPAVAPASGAEPKQAEVEVRRFLRGLLADWLRKPPETIDTQAGYYELGIDSAALLELVHVLEQKIAAKLPPTLLFEHVTVEQLAAFLCRTYPQKLSVVTARPPEAERSDTASSLPVPGRARPRGEDIAIVGMAGRFPGASSVREFWENLKSGKDSVGEVPGSRWDWRAFQALRSPSGKPLSRWGGFLDDVDCFDAQFFRISPREAESLDPQERLFLEVCWEAIEDSGYTPRTLADVRGADARRPVGVFAGVMHKDYALLANELTSAETPVVFSQSNAPVANRVSFVCNFHGPSMSVDTVCSSSLIAVHLAVQSIRAGECDVAIAGGVNLSLHPAKYLAYGMMDMHASDGRCNAFGKGGDGYVSSEAVAAIVLKPYAQALADGDNVYAVIKGSSTNHGGAASGFTVPNPVAQADVIAACLERAGTPARTIGYVEAHGTGTALGDPIEVEGLARAFRRSTDDVQFCGIGSVKSNIGHTESAAGVCGLIKLALQLRHRTIVPSLHAAEPNPHIDWPRTPFVVETAARPWPEPPAAFAERDVPRARRAAISSFGATGSNAHVVLEEHRPADPARTVAAAPADIRPVVVPLSAADAERLRVYAERLASFLRDDQAAALVGDHAAVDLAALASTLQTGREPMAARVAFVVDSVASLRDMLTRFARGERDVPGCYGSDEPRDADGARESARGDDAVALARLFVSGADVQWGGSWRYAQPRRVSLPTYPFAKERYWLLGRGEGKAAGAVARGEVEESGKPRVRLLGVEAAEQREGLVRERGAGVGFESAQAEGVAAGSQAQALAEAEALAQAEAEALEAQAEALEAQAAAALAVREVAKEGRSVANAARVGKQERRGDLQGRLEEELSGSLGEALYLERERIDRERAFVEMGLDSIIGVEWIRTINERFGIAIPTTRLYDYPTVRELAKYLSGIVSEERVGAPAQQEREEQEECAQAPREEREDREEERAARRAEQAVVRSEQEPVLGAEKRSRGGYGVAIETVSTLEEVGLREWEVPEPGEDEVTVEVRASAINFPDVMCVQGLYPTMPEYPFVPGFEVAGVVKRVGRAVRGVEVGEEVIAVTGKQLGGHASEVNVLPSMLMRKPANLTFEEACSVPVVFGTVAYAFEVGRLSAGEHVLIQTATGGCGLAALQLARLKGCECYGTSSREEKREILRRLSVQHALDYRQEFDRELRRITHGRGVDVVLNMVSGEPMQRGLNSLAAEGRYLELAVQGLRSSGKLDLSMLVNNQSVHSIDLRRMTLKEEKSWARSMQPIMEGLESGRLVPVVSRVYPVQQVGEALRYVAQGEHIGKVVLSHTRTRMEDWTQRCIEGLIEQGERSRREAGAWTGSVQFEAVAQERAAPAQSAKRPSAAAAARSAEEEGIAIIGMSGAFPCARNLEEYWENLQRGRDCVSEIPRERWSVEKYYAAQGQEAGKSCSRWMGRLEEMELFDPLFFNISPAEAEWMDPQQRLILEHGWSCIEEAGIDPQSLSGKRCAVYVGCSPGDYGQSREGDGLTAQGLMGNAPSILAARIAYFLNLKGPCVAIDTACSSSLVALAEACDSLVLKRSDLALAGGVSVLSGPGLHIMASNAGMLSRQGRCFTFDERADGFVPAEGVGVVLLKRLADAKRDGDPIHAVVRGWGVNHDGKTNGLTAPSVSSQILLEKGVYERFGIDPQTITLVEAHGTGTRLGDPIEVEALTEAFRAYTGERHYCALGSVKSNIGHALAAAGVAGVLKAALSLRERRLAPTIHFESLNEHIGLKDGPFYILREGGEWPAQPGPRRAAVSSFGFSGTNAHVVLEEAPQEQPAGGGRVGGGRSEPALIVLSARSEPQLREQARRLLKHLQSAQSLDLHDVAYTLQVGRTAMDQRLAFTARDVEEVRRKLDACVRSNAIGADVEGCHRGDVKKSRDLVAALESESRSTDIDTWIAQRDFAKVLDLWSKGLAVDWSKLYGAESVYAGAKPRRRSLPTYSFARERHWVTAALQSVAQTPARPQHDERASIAISARGAEPVPEARGAAARRTDELVVFAEDWERAESQSDAADRARSAAAARDPLTVVVFLCDARLRALLSEAIARLGTRARLVFVGHGGGIRAADELSVDDDTPQSYARALGRARAEHGRIDAVWYLWSLEQLRPTSDQRPIVDLIRAFAETELREVRLLLAGEHQSALERCHLESWIAYRASVQRALPGVQVTTVHAELSPGARGDGGADARRWIETWSERLWSETLAGNGECTRYVGADRHVLRTKPVELDVASTRSAFRRNGTYLITGGLGGLGYRLAEHLARRYAARLVLTGRDKLDDRKKAQLDALKALGGEALYLRADVADAAEMRRVIAQARARFDAIHGVVHAAGVAGDGSVLTNDWQDSRGMLRPKIDGTSVLADLLAGEKLDFLCHFSSAAAVLGDFGACAYAVGNRFQLAHAKYACPNAIAICWPVWADGGMRVNDDEGTRLYLESSGQRALEAPEGLEILERLLAHRQLHRLDHAALLVGDGARLRELAGLSRPAVRPRAMPAKAASRRRPELQGLRIEECVLWEVHELASELSKLPREKLHVDDNLADFGFDSIRLAALAKRLSERYGFEVVPSVFFSHPTLQRLAAHLAAKHRQVFEQRYEACEPVEAVTAELVAPRATIVATVRAEPARPGGVELDEPIAIIGMSGRFPDSRNVEDLWRILAEGRNAVREIPLERFDWRPYYREREETQGVDIAAAGTISSKWLGVVPGAEEFDPLFFEISPRDAEFMDPRQRLLLQESFGALEDAGYGPIQLDGQRTAMFVGVEQGDYQMVVGGAGSVGANHDAILAARLAYFLDLRGPVMAINTACSSGLVAVHQACSSLRLGECDTAVAAAANLILTPHLYFGMSQAGMLSPHGKCYAFDERANGMVPGEAVVAVVLKRLSRAEADGDPIYAVIRGTGLNYDGRTNGLTAPNGVAQAELINDVYRRAKVDPASVEYIVTHGTGTRLGDPVEINALKDAFGDGGPVGRCALTSTKSNVGHTFAASGLVSLVALVQALQRETIPASLHCERRSDYVDWASSPFYVNTENKAWPRRAKPRIGAVSAFGMSGTNAHAVVESYDDERAGAESPHDFHAPFYLFAVSAKTEAALRKRVADLIAVLETEEPGGRPDLASISYTLLHHRHHFARRGAVVAADRAQAVALLKAFLAEEPLPGVLRGKAPKDFAEQPALKRYAADLVNALHAERSRPDRYRESLTAVADLYCQGYRIDWTHLLGARPPKRCRLPAYPFGRERYWAAASSSAIVGAAPAATLGSAELAASHPLAHADTSARGARRVSSTFDGREFFLRDHVVGGRPVLPSVCYLEMIRAALAASPTAHARPGTAIRLRNLVWLRPIVADAARRVHVEWQEREAGEIEYSVYTTSGDASFADAADALVHAQGRGSVVGEVEPSTVDLEVARRGCDRRIDVADCYAAFAATGVDYGPAYRVLRSLSVGELAGEPGVVADVSLPDELTGMRDRYCLHPSVLDGALQASLGLGLDPTLPQPAYAAGSSRLPFALEELEILRNPPTHVCVLVRRRASQAGDPGKEALERMDIEVCDREGRVCVRMKGLTVRVRRTEITLLRPVWAEAAPPATALPPRYAERWVLLAPIYKESAAGVESRCGCRVRVLSGGADDPIAATHDGIRDAFEVVRTVLQGRPKQPVLMQVVVPVDDARGGLLAALGGMLRTASIENTRLTWQLLELDAGAAPDELAARLESSAGVANDAEIRYAGAARRVLTWQELAPRGSGSAERRTPWKDRGVYLISGGAGGLGLVFAGEIARRASGATVILASRSAPGLETQARLAALERNGTRIVHRRLDVTDAGAVESCIRDIVARHGSLDGVIHSAGVLRDSFVIKKAPGELAEVLAPKVSGTINLDRATRDVGLDFFLLFSSVTATRGNVGQCDYATANAFMDRYAAYRARLVAAGQRRGRTLSVNWPLWAEGGMRVDEATLERLTRKGIEPLATADGIEMLYEAYASDAAQVVVMPGDRQAVRSLFRVTPAVAPTTANDRTAPSPRADDPSLRAQVQRTLVETIAELLKVRSDEIDFDAELSDFGFDSISLTQFCNVLNQTWALELLPTIFFEHPTVRGLAEHLVAEFGERLAPVAERAIAAESPLSAVPSAAPVAAAASAADSRDLNDAVRRTLIEALSDLLKVSREDVDADAELSDFGFDSISLTQFCNVLNRSYGLELLPTVFFEYPTVRKLADHLVADYGRQLRGALPAAVEGGRTAGSDETPVAATSERSPAEPVRDERGAAPVHTLRASASVAAVPTDSRGVDAIAIIGMAARFPQARDLHEFWRNLRGGKDCITEIPPERWDWKAVFGDPRVDDDRTNARWGGFIEGADEFDPHFFGILPQEARRMDPQQRLTMMYAWKALEDAGYSAESLSGSSTGIFVGTAGSDYSLVLSQSASKLEGYSSRSSMSSLGPSRTSYFLNLHGPSEPIETACSSSLVAVHRAVQAIRAGDCEMALAGGVYTMFTPVAHIVNGKAGALSPDGRCKTFSKHANGYVPGEGVGMLFLKKLAQAEADGDHVYAVIRGSGENHGGRASSLTAPNPQAQADLLKGVYSRTGIDPATVTYIEAHGTGTPLGDPIEINALKTAFADLRGAGSGDTVTAPWCGIGSVKTNIGHLEFAAGVAGLIKVVLQLEHRTLVKTLHCEERNPYIQIEGSPFYIVDAERDWQAVRDADGRDLPRRAGVSSFGFGGVNAHVILEEYVARDPDPSAIGEQPTAALIALSARTEERLKDRVRQLLDAIANGTVTDANLVDAAYTLQIGREPMECRLAFTASSLADLRDKLGRILESPGLTDGCYRGNAKARLSADRADTSQQELVDAVECADYGALLDAWVNGRPFDWRRLYGPTSEYCRQRPRRMSLPTYAFATESYWITARARAVARSVDSEIARTLDRDALELLIGAHLTDEVRVDAAAKITELLASA